MLNTTNKNNNNQMNQNNMNVNNNNAIMNQIMKQEIPIIKLTSTLLFDMTTFKDIIDKQSSIVNKLLFTIFEHCQLPSIFDKIRKTYLFGEPSLFYNLFNLHYYQNNSHKKI